MPDSSPRWTSLALLPLLFAAATASPARATPLKPETKQKLIALRTAIKTWAPICDGALALSQPPQCTQGDMVEYSGMSCAGGDTARCQDLKRSQGADGRFWRSPNRVDTDKGDTFSRDMLMGVFDYALATKDKAALERYYEYLRGHKNKMCPDASDNRCHLLPGTWGIFGLVMKQLGIHRPALIVAAKGTIDIDLLLGANTVPAGYQMELVAHHVMVRRALGQDTAVMKEAARHIAKKQPLNPLFVWLRDGATEEAAALAQEICKPTKGALANDIFFQRELKRNAAGEIIVIRDWHEPVPPKASDVANGHDCLIVLNWLIAG